MPYSLINSIAGIKLSFLIPVSLSTRMVTKSGTHYIADTVSGTGDIVTNLVETGLWTRVTDVHWNLDGKVMQSEMDSSSREKRKDHEEVMLESFTGHWVRSPECHQNINPVNARVFFFFFFANFASHFIPRTYNTAWHAAGTQYTSIDGMNQFMNPQVYPY